MTAIVVKDFMEDHLPHGDSKDKVRRVLPTIWPFNLSHLRHNYYIYFKRCRRNKLLYDTHVILVTLISHTNIHFISYSTTVSHTRSVISYLHSSLSILQNTQLTRSAVKSVAAGIAGAVLTNPLDVIRNEYVPYHTVRHYSFYQLYDITTNIYEHVCILIFLVEKSI